MSDVTIRSLGAHQMRDSVGTTMEVAEDIAGRSEAENSEEKKNGENE